jgi:hypothetical protein
MSSLFGLVAGIIVLSFFLGSAGIIVAVVLAVRRAAGGSGRSVGSGYSGGSNSNSGGGFWGGRRGRRL